MNKKLPIILLPLLLIVSCSTDGNAEKQERHIHHYVVEEGVAPTCLEDGTTNKVYCEECGYVLHDHDELKATGHSFVDIEAKEEGITSIGYKKYQICEHCGLKVGYEEIPPTYLMCKIDSSIEGDTSHFQLHFNKTNIACSTTVTIRRNNEVNELSFEGDKFDYKLEHDKLYSFTFETTYEDGDKEVLTSVQKLLSLDNPVVYITTDDYLPVLSKEVYKTASFSMDSENISGEPCKIKTRGNSTSVAPKKPYRIKFDNKVSLFGLKKAKNWVLLANYYDKSLSRNDLAFDLAHQMFDDSIFVPTAHYVEVVINNSYMGLYTLCEHIQTGKGRVDINETLDPSDIGFLIEIDERIKYEEGTTLNVDYVVSHGHSFGIKTPDTESVEYLENVDTYVGIIQQHLDDAFSVLAANDWSDIESTFDVDSFLNNYLIQELFANNDCGFSSFYLYRNKGGKIIAGPVWDFDIGAGNVNYNLGNVDECPADTALYATPNNVFFKKLLQHDEFVDLLKARITAVDSLVQSTVDSYSTSNSNSPFNKYNHAMERNFQTWGIMGIYVWPQPKSVYTISTIEGQFDYLIDWLTARWNFIKDSYSI